MHPIRATEYIELYIQQERVKARRHPSQTPCPQCGDMGFLITRDSLGYEVSRRCRCWGLDQRIRAFNQARVPVRYLDAHLEGFHPRDLSGHEALWRA